MPRMARTAGALVLLVLGLAGVPAGAQAQGCVDARLQPGAANAVQVASATLCYVNVERAKAGLPVLKPHASLARAAEVHSRDMVAKRFFGHRGSDGSDVMVRVKRTGYFRGVRRFGARENLAWGAGPRGAAAATVKAWMGSAVHRKAILDREVREAGVGVVDGSPSGGSGATYTMVFGYRR